MAPNARFFTALLHCYGRGRDGAAVADAWADLKAVDGLQPDLILFSAMINACAKVCCRCCHGALCAGRCKRVRCIQGPPLTACLCQFHNCEAAYLAAGMTAL